MLLLLYGCYKRDVYVKEQVSFCSASEILVPQVIKSYLLWSEKIPVIAGESTTMSWLEFVKNNFKNRNMKTLRRFYFTLKWIIIWEKREFGRSLKNQLLKSFLNRVTSWFFYCFMKGIVLVFLLYFSKQFCSRTKNFYLKLFFFNLKLLLEKTPADYFNLYRYHWEGIELWTFGCRIGYWQRDSKIALPIFWGKRIQMIN